MIEKKPLITIVMPYLYEEAYVGKALRSLLDDWAVRNCEVLIRNPPETSERIKALIRLLDNRDKIASCGMNLGIAQAAGKIIVRADAHCLFPPGYVRRCVELLADTGAANAGGAMVPRGEGGIPFRIIDPAELIDNVLPEAFGKMRASKSL